MAVSRNQLAILARVLAVVPVVIDDLFDNTVELLINAAIDEDVDVLVNILNQWSPKIARIQKYYEETVPLFNHAQFRYYFGMQLLMNMSSYLCSVEKYHLNITWEGGHQYSWESRF